MISEKDTERTLIAKAITEQGFSPFVFEAITHTKDHCKTVHNIDAIKYVELTKRVRVVLDEIEKEYECNGISFAIISGLFVVKLAELVQDSMEDDNHQTLN